MLAWPRVHHNQRSLEKAAPMAHRAGSVGRVIRVRGALVTSGAGVDEEGLGAAEGDVGVEGEVLARD